MNDEHDEILERESTGDEFWGRTPDWSTPTSRIKRVTPARRTDLKGAIKGWWGSALTAGAEPTREHRMLDSGQVNFDDHRGDDHDTGRMNEPRPRIDASMFDDLDDAIPMVPTGRQRIVEPSIVDDEMRRELGQLSAGTSPAKARDVSHSVVGQPDRIAFDQDADDRQLDQATFDQDAFDMGADDAFAFAPASMAERLDDHRAARRGIDPLLARLGAVAVVMSLAVPLAMGMASDGGDTDTLASNDTATLSATSPTVAAIGAATSEPAPDTEPLDPAQLPDAVPVADEQASATQPAATAEATVERADDAYTEGADEVPSTTSPADDADVSSSDATADVVTDVSKPASVDTDAERVTNCAVEYVVVEGDFWIRLAEGAGVPLAELLEANGATVDSSLFPGMTICLPAGSSTPPPPVTTEVPATDPPTTAAPTTVAPTTTATPVGTEAVKQIIRDVWPDDLEDRAIEIANRESRFDPLAKNYCCYGVFQIYWSVHKGWLDDLGVTSDQQLFDPATNVRAAYALYQRSGGWGPWGF